MGSDQHVTIGSLCTGYDGLDMAVQSVLGGTLAWVADNDAGAAALLAHHHPDVPNLGDITVTDWEQVQPVDVLTAGYPCQPFSAAGLRKGTADERHIWPFIADGIRVLRPRLVVLENVPNHLRLGFADVLADLARLGFDAEWCLVRASEVGAPHPRARLFVVAQSADAQGEGFQGSWLRGRSARSDRAAAHADRFRDHGSRATGRSAQRHTSGADRPAADAQGVGRDARWPEPAWEQGRPDVALGGGVAADTARLSDPNRPERHHGEFFGAKPGPSAGDRDGRTAAGAGGADGHPGVVAWGPYGPAIDRWASVLGRPAPDPVGPTATGGQGLSPHFVEWLMGLPDGWITGVPGLTRNQMLRLGGNGVVPQQGAAALAVLLDRMAVAS